MTKQEQVKEILEVIKHCGDYTNRDCAECDYRLYGQCHNQKQCEAEALYNEGYRKIDEFEKCRKCPAWSGTDCTRNPYTEGCLDDKVNLKNEIKRLEKENACLLKACEEQFTFDTTQNKKYSVFNSVRKEFAEKLKEKALLHCRTINCYECKFIETTIDELLEEYEE